MKRSAKVFSQFLAKRSLAQFIGGLSLLVVNVEQVLAETAKTLKLPESTPAKQSAVTGDSVFGVVFSLLIVIAVIFMLAWIMRRMNGTAPKPNALMKVVGGLSMGTRERVVLVQVGEQQLLLGVAPGRIQTLHVLDKPIQDSDVSDFSAGSFADRLKSIVNKEK